MITPKLILSLFWFVLTVCSAKGLNDSAPRRVLVIGSTGVGKSTLINALVGKQVMDTSSNAKGCTSSYATAPVVRHGIEYEFLDTVGLNEAEGGTVSKKDAVKMFFRFLSDNGEGFNLIIFCIRQDRLTSESKATYDLMIKQLYSYNKSESPPILIFVSGFFVGFKHPQDWCNDNRETFLARGYSEVARSAGDLFHCLSIPPKDLDPNMERIYAKKRKESTARAWKVVEANIVESPRPFYKDFKGMLKTLINWWNQAVDYMDSWGLNNVFNYSKVVPHELKSILSGMGFTTRQFWEAIQDLV